MAKRPVRDPIDNLAPTFDLSVANSQVGATVSALVQTISYEMTDGLVDECRVVLSNPDFILTDKRIFQVGNELDVWVGYGTSLVHLGRTVIVKTTPTFPQASMPVLQVTGYTRDYQMMDREPETSSDRAFVEASYDEAVHAVAARNGFETDIDQTLQYTDFFQKAGVSDYDFVRGLANLVGYQFWVDADDTGLWTLHFRDPETASDQEVRYTFAYSLQKDGPLLSFVPQQLIKGGPTKIKATVKDTNTGKLLVEELEVTDNPAETEYTGTVEQDVDKPPTSAEAVKLFIGDFSFQVVPARRLTTQAELRTWIEQWFRRMRQHFIMGKGRTIGLETLRPREVHELTGLGTVYDGDYYLPSVRHLISSESGYLCEFDSRKVI